MRYEFASTQVDLPGAIAGQVKLWAKNWIPDDLLAADGREEDPHITVKYGLHSDNVGPVEEALRGMGPIVATLGAVKAFTTNPDFDVLYLEVQSPGLREANARIKQGCVCTDTHPVYRPHATLAYVRKGAGAPLLGAEPFAGEPISFRRIVLMCRDGERRGVTLAPITARQGRYHSDADIRRMGSGLQKAARLAPGEVCPHCGAAHEQEGDGESAGCNRCNRRRGTKPVPDRFLMRAD
jgi:2'-5' RNA ligase/DNA-directed RNA polymerase subunit RPC12/RpoP